MSRYERAPRQDPAEELALRLEEMRLVRPPAGLDEKQSRQWHRKQLEKEVIDQIRRGLTWDGLAQVLRQSEDEVRETYEAAVLRIFGTTRLTRWGPAKVRTRTILIYRQKEDSTQVVAVVDPQGEDLPGAADGWMPQGQPIEIRAGDDEELLEKLTERLGVRGKHRPADLEQVVRAVGAVRKTLAVEFDWPTVDEYRLVEPYDVADLTPIVEAVYANFGESEGHLQAAAFGFHAR